MNEKKINVDNLSCVECGIDSEMKELSWDEYGKLICSNCGHDEFCIFVKKESGK